jgi:hypothetical protein
MGILIKGFTVGVFVSLGSVVAVTKAIHSPPDTYLHCDGEKQV